MHDVERAIARIAGRQDNVITREQLLGAGLGRGAIAHRVKARTMQRLHTNVYLLGAAPPTQMGRARAAVLACGDGAAVSHRSAAEMFGLLPEIAGDVHVTVAGRNVSPREGIRIHRVAAFARGEVTKMRGIPVTSVARIVCDLAATEPEREVVRAFQEALYRDIVTDRALDSFRRPLTNVPLHGHLVDAYWPAEGLVLEYDGWPAHGHRLAFDRDRKLDRVMLAHGKRVTPEQDCGTLRM